MEVGIKKFLAFCRKLIRGPHNTELSKARVKVVNEKSGEAELSGFNMKRIVISFFIIILLVLLGLYVKVKIDINKFENKMHDYLTISKGYKEEEILGIRSELSKLPKYPVYVTFKDEPNFTYTYVYLGSEKGWFQFPPPGNYNPRDFKHLQESEQY
ncbi:DUF3139 domain-containing protein [Paenibacillus spongiae]|uniref:DUF3139 domain-containing protein n=1 Tax=Paenibacillus spongiae TaxID=2909671 RepID=A0ABY5S5T6_9BACL|nr:DUF3139 domain-containing protein [Paenibacillus spongiae]UVI29274.1 DUF3139 domain-containing protein [Paenibacillus spongiae]